MNQLFNFQHPLPLETRIRATKPNCPCKGGGTSEVIGTIKKTITNQSGHWYYLDIGSTVSANWITEIF